MHPATIHLKFKAIIQQGQVFVVNRFGERDGKLVRFQHLVRFRIQECSRDYRRHKIVHIVDSFFFGTLAINRKLTAHRDRTILYSTTSRISHVDTGQFLFDIIIFRIIEFEAHQMTVLRNRQVIQFRNDFQKVAIFVEPVELEVHVLKVIFGYRRQETHRSTIHTTIAITVIEAVQFFVDKVTARVLHRNLLVILACGHAVSSGQGSIGATFFLAARSFYFEQIPHMHRSLLYHKRPLGSVFRNCRDFNRRAIEIQTATGRPRRVQYLIESNNQGILVVSTTLKQSRRLNGSTDTIDKCSLQRNATVTNRRANQSLNRTRRRITLQLNVYTRKTIFIAILYRFAAVRFKRIVVRPAVFKTLDIHRFSLTAKPGRNAIANAITIGIVDSGLIQRRHVGISKLERTRERPRQKKLVRILRILERIQAERRIPRKSLLCRYQELTLAFIKIETNGAVAQF